jgi:regulator of replication initiation timing
MEAEHIYMMIGTSGVVSIANWLLFPRKRKAEVQSTELDNYGKIIKMWKDLSEDMERRFREEIDELKKENCALKKQINDVLAENEQLRMKLRHFIEISVETESNRELAEGITTTAEGKGRRRKVKSE